MRNKIIEISINKVDAFFFDFDGVMTNNFVYLDEDGKESVRCSRADGLAFDVLRKLKKPCYILSSEKNPVVARRAAKLKVPLIQGAFCKVNSLKELASKNLFKLKNILYVGNDLNDYHVMKIIGYSVCPADSHSRIKEISDIVLKKNGGEGVVRCLLEDVLGLDFIKILYEN